METQYVLAFCFLSFLAGSLVTMILFTILDDRLDKKFRASLEEVRSR